MKPYILVLEDDHLQTEPLRDSLEGAFPDVDVRVLGTERSFREWLAQPAEGPPEAVVLDVMLKWDLPRADAPPPPPDVEAGGYYRAGLRCANLLRGGAGTGDVPVVLYTILERSDLERDGATFPPGVRYLRKSADTEALVRQVRQVVGRRVGR